MADDDLDRCQVCGAIATVWWPQVDGQWCDWHVPDAMAHPWDDLDDDWDDLDDDR